MASMKGIPGMEGIKMLRRRRKGKNFEQMGDQYQAAARTPEHERARVAAAPRRTRYTPYGMTRQARRRGDAAARQVPQVIALCGCRAQAVPEVGDAKCVDDRGQGRPAAKEES